jgi:hypothetical protein
LGFLALCGCKSFFSLFDPSAKTAVIGKFAGQAAELIAEGCPATDVEQIGNSSLTQPGLRDIRIVRIKVPSLGTGIHANTPHSHHAR